MKKILLLNYLALSLLLYVNTAQADYTFYLGAPNACAAISNNWVGKGRVYNWAVDCYYRGIGNISNVDSVGNFQLSINVNKDSGSLICPNNYADHFTGKCVNGYVTIATGYGDLIGSVSGNAGSASGSLTIAGVKANLDIMFKTV